VPASPFVSGRWPFDFGFAKMSLVDSVFQLDIRRTGARRRFSTLPRELNAISDPGASLRDATN
jgi:hypothetical protein